jgi:hypothetical protein
MKKQKQPETVYCRDCRHATPDMQFKNLSVDGKPTLLICDIIKWPKKVISEKGCEKFEKR